MLATELPYLTVLHSRSCKKYLFYNSYLFAKPGPIQNENMGFLFLKIMKNFKLARAGHHTKYRALGAWGSVRMPEPMLRKPALLIMITEYPELQSNLPRMMKLIS